MLHYLSRSIKPKAAYSYPFKLVHHKTLASTLQTKIVRSPTSHAHPWPLNKRFGIERCNCKVVRSSLKWFRCISAAYAVEPNNNRIFRVTVSVTRKLYLVILSNLESDSLDVTISESWAKIFGNRCDFTKDQWDETVAVTSYLVGMKR